VTCESKYFGGVSVTSLLPTQPDIPHTKTTPDIYRPQTVWERRGVSDTSAEYLLDCGVSPRLKPLQCLPWLVVAGTNECVCVILTASTHTHSHIEGRATFSLSLSLSLTTAIVSASLPSHRSCLSVWSCSPLGGGRRRRRWAVSLRPSQKASLLNESRGKGRQDAGSVFTVV